jgi:hypothetical protein
MSFGAFSRRGLGGGNPNPFARPTFEVVFEDSGLNAPGGSFDAWQPTGHPVGWSVIGAGGAPVSTWRNGKRACSFGGLLAQNIGGTGAIELSAVTERTWYFALQIPPDAGGFSGVGPTSTADETGKNFPLYFKSSTVIGSQPSASNRDSALDMSPYYGLDAIISVRQSATGIRFSMRIDGVSGRVTTTASGEACASESNGWSMGGWFGGGGGFAGPLALSGVVSGALSDADQDEGVDYLAWEYDLITP